MSTESLAQLREQLAADPPAAFGVLAGADIALLAGALRDEKAAQNAGLEQAAEEALKLVPGVARGPVRRILFK